MPLTSGSRRTTAPPCTTPRSSSNAGYTAWTSHLVAAILADEISARRDIVFFRDQRNPLAVLAWLTDDVATGAPAQVRTRRMLQFAPHGGEEVREGFRNTCAVPSVILDKPRATLSLIEWERLRLHPYHAERILTHVPVLEPVVPLVAAHRERLDGAGYYRGLSGSQIPRGARIIAVADRFDELAHDTPGQRALAPEQALHRMSDEMGRGLCPDAYQALVQEVRAGAGPSSPHTGTGPPAVVARRLTARGVTAPIWHTPCS